MSQAEIVEIQQRLGLPDSWKPTPPMNATLIGRNFKAVLRGRIEILESPRAGEIIIMTDAGPIYLEDQIIELTRTNEERK